MLSRRMVLFVLCGGVAAMANMGSRYLFNLVFSYPVAIVLAYWVGMGVAFFLFKTKVFDVNNGRSVVHQVGWFIAINGLALLQTLVISIALSDYLLPWLGLVWRRHDAAHAVGVLVPVFTSYIGHKRLTFSKGHSCA